MSGRLSRHKAERPAGWCTLEAPDDVVTALNQIDAVKSFVVLDCLTLWLSARFERSDEAILMEWDSVLGALKVGPHSGVIVGNEVGWSLVPESFALRRFRDLAGLLGQRTAAAADETWLYVAGCPLKIK